MVSFFTRQAENLHPKRWWFLGSFILAIATLLLILPHTSGKVSFLTFALISPVIFGSWGLLCMCVWFHPIKGRMQNGSGFVGKLPSGPQRFFRWYAAVTLAFFMLLGAVAFPVFAVFSVIFS